MARGRRVHGRGDARSECELTMSTELYTNSRLRVLRQCMRLHHFRYGLGIQTPTTPEARFGTVGHEALEAYYRAWQAVPGDDDVQPVTDISSHEAAEAAWIRRDEALATRLPAALSVISSSDLSPWDQVKLRLLVIAYHERWGGEDWEILAVEQEFRYGLGEHLIGGKIDAIIRDRPDGRVYVLEHKFTGSETSLGGPYWERLTLDSQVSIYIDGATMLGYDVSGCIYDVIKRPEHEAKLATPIEKREYTKGRGCKRCGGSAKPGSIEKGRGGYDVVFASEVKVVDCDECDGTGWKKNAAGVPDAPRLHANQRDADETVEAFEERLLEALAERPDNFLQRGKVVRLEDELPGLRQDLLDDIALAETGLTPRNPDACARFGTMCPFFDPCAGRADIDDTKRFPRGRAHPELAADQP